MNESSPTSAHTSHAASNWPERVYSLLLDIGVRQVAYVPDAGHARLIELARTDSRTKAIALTTEEEGVALTLGAHLGGQKSVLLMQSSGVGNCINMLAMTAECRAPLLMLVTMRGEWGEFNPWQVPMAQATATVLEAMHVIVKRAERVDDIVETVSAAAALAFNSSRAVAVLISQRALGAKAFKQ